jgi:hypothetical protein
MCFQSKMLQVDSTTGGHIFTVRTLRRHGSQGVLQPKINLGIQGILRDGIPDELRGVGDEKRGNHGHAYDATQAQISFAVVTNELQWIFGFPQSGGLGISIQQKSEIRFGYKRQQQAHINTDQPILQGKICQFIVDITIEHDEIYA